MVLRDGAPEPRVRLDGRRRAGAGARAGPHARSSTTALDPQAAIDAPRWRVEPWDWRLRVEADLDPGRRRRPRGARPPARRGGAHATSGWATRTRSRSGRTGTRWRPILGPRAPRSACSLAPVMVDRVADVRDALLAHDYLADDGLATVDLPGAEPRSARSCSRARRGSARPRSRRCSPAGPAASSSGCSATRASTPRRRVYEWDYSAPAAAPAGHRGGGRAGRRGRALHRAVPRAPAAAAGDRPRGGTPPVLLIDEVDRADDEFEAFLLELLSDYSVTIPELGVIRAETPPVVILTSNRTRDVHDALEASLPLPLDRPPRLRARGRDRASARRRRWADRWPARSRARPRCCASLDLYKPPGVAETIDWADRAGAPRRRRISTRRRCAATLGVVLKYREDQARLRDHGLAATATAVARVPSHRTVPASASGPERPGSQGRSGEAVPTAIAVGVRRGRLAGARRGLRVPTGSTVTFAEALRRGRVGERRRRLLGGARHAVQPARGRRAVRRAASVRGSPRSAAPTRPTALGARRRGGRARRARRRRTAARRCGRRRRRRRVPILRCGSAAAEMLRHRDFATYTAAEHDEARRVLADLRLAGARRRSRRLTPRRARAPPARRAPHAAGRAAHGGRAAPAGVAGAVGRGPRRLVFLCDVSGSMEPYARVLVRFLHSAVVARDAGRGVRVRHPAHPHHPRALEPRPRRRASPRPRSGSSTGRAGRGSARRCTSSTTTWGMRGMARGAVVVVISDGWDRGEPELLAEQMARLARVAHRIVWVNPLKASPGFAPLAAGMAAALPFVDDFVEGHSIASLDGARGDRRRRRRDGGTRCGPGEGGARRHRPLAGRGSPGRGRAGRRRRRLGAARPRRHDGGERRRRGRRLGLGRLRRGRGRRPRRSRSSRASSPGASSRFGYSDDEAFAVGLTCGGTVHLFVEPLDW